MLDEMLAGTVPATVAEFERLAEHYAIGSVWMGLHSLREVMAGQMRWEEWLPDGVHPQHRGSLSYAQSVIAFLEHELIASPSKRKILSGENMPAPLNAMNWEHAHALPFSAVRLDGPWIIRRWTKYSWIDQVLETAAVGAKLSFDFAGRALTLGFDFGTTSSEFRYRLDGSAWQVSRRDRPVWCGPEGWYRVSTIAEDLQPGRHTFELEVIHGNSENCTGTNCRLALIGVVA